MTTLLCLPVRLSAYVILGTIGFLALAPAAHRTAAASKFVPGRAAHSSFMRLLPGRRLVSTGSPRPRGGPQLAVRGSLGARDPLSPVLQWRASRRIRMSFDTRSVEWINALEPRTRDSASSAKARVVPVFLLDSNVGARSLIPGTEESFNIIEPRYVSMYDDLLMKGSRSFAIFARNPKDQKQLAAVGVILYLTDLKEVSEQTDGAVKYQCAHNVTGRVLLRGVINPQDATSRETYVKAEVSDLVDVDDDEDTKPLEVATLSALIKVAELQEAIDEKVRFDKNLVEKLHAGRGAEDGSLWNMAALWKRYLDVRAVAICQKIQIEVLGALIQNPVELLAAWIEERVVVNTDGDEAQVALAQTLLRRLGEEVDPLFVEQSRAMQLMLQTDRHAERLRIFTELIENDTTRLRARAMLKETFQSEQGL